MSLIKHLDIKILGGVALIIIGIALLGQNTGLFTIGNLFWGILFFLVGVFFISIFINNRQHWWGLIPAYGLLGGKHPASPRNNIAPYTRNIGWRDYFDDACPGVYPYLYY